MKKKVAPLKYHYPQKASLIGQIFLTFVFFITLYPVEVSAQEIKFYSNEKIKSENGLKGVKRDKDWTVPPQYDKIEGYGKSKFSADYLLCYKGAVIDVYKANFNQELVVTGLNQSQLEVFKLYESCPKIPIIKDKKWTDVADNLTPSQKKVYDNLYPNEIAYIKNGKWGFANGYYNVEPKFDSLFTICYEDYAGKQNCNDINGVTINGKKGAVTSEGVYFIQPDNYTSFKYEYIARELNRQHFILTCTKANGTKDYFNPLARIKLEGFETYLNEYANYVNFIKSLKVVKGKNNKLGLITTDGKLVLPTLANEIYFYTSCKFYFLFGEFRIQDGKGNTINNTSGDTIPISSILSDNEIKSSVANLTIKTNSESLTNKEITIEVTDKYDYKAPLNTYYKCSNCTNPSNNEFCRYCNANTVRYDKIVWYPEKNIFSYYENPGKKLPKADLSSINKLLFNSEGMHLAMDKSTRKYGYLNSRDEIVLPFEYESASGFGNNLAPVTLNGKKVYIDKTGKEIINAEKYAYTQCFYNGYAVVKNAQEMYAFIDTLGNLKTDFVFTKADGFSQGLAAVKKDGKCGFLGLDLKPAIPLVYKWVDYFTETGLSHVVTMQDKHGYINTKGEFVIPAIYDDGTKDWNLIENNPASGWPYHTYKVQRGTITEFLDAKGKVVPKPGEETINSTDTKKAIALVNEIKNKSFSIKVYPKWAEKFSAEKNANGTDEIWIYARDVKKKEFYEGAPDSWLKISNFSEETSPNIMFRFSELESTIAKERQELIDFNTKRSGMLLSKISHYEQEVTLADGRKGTMFFYNTHIAMGGVNGVDCEIVCVSKSNPKKVTKYMMAFETGDMNAENLPEKDLKDWANFFAKMLLTVKKLN